jgi:hypothetical protein
MPMRTGAYAFRINPKIAIRKGQHHSARGSARLRRKLFFMDSAGTILNSSALPARFRPHYGQGGNGAR